MRSFTDNADRQWTVNINVDTIRRVRSETNVDLLEILDGKLAEDLSTDPVLMCDILFAVCKPEADQRGLSAEDFGCGLAGDAIEFATDALLEEITDFFPRSRRQLLSAVLARRKRLEHLAANKIEQQMAAPELDRLLESKMEQEIASHWEQLLGVLGGSSGTSPESSVSNPAA